MNNEIKKENKMQYQIGDQVEIIGDIQGWKGRVGIVIFIYDSGDLQVECDDCEDDRIHVMNREVKPFLVPNLYNTIDFCPYPSMAECDLEVNTTNAKYRKAQDTDAARYTENVRR